jgi:hypothetical protein
MIPSEESLLSIANDDTIRLWNWRNGSVAQTVHVGNIGLQSAVTIGSKVIFGCRNGSIHECTPAAGGALSMWAEARRGYEWEVVKVMATDGDVVVALISRGKVPADAASAEMDMQTEVRVWDASS